MDKITTYEGELWDEIAKRALGSEKHMTDMIAANPEWRGYVMLPGGAELVVPTVETSAGPAVLPPWKRV